MSLTGDNPIKNTLSDKLKKTTALIYYANQFVSSGIVFKINNTVYCITAGHSIYGNKFNEPKEPSKLKVEVEKNLLYVEEVIGDAQFAGEHDIVILKFKKLNNSLDIPNVEFWPVPQSPDTKLVYRGSYKPDKGIHNFRDTHFDEFKTNSSKFRIDVNKDYLVNSNYTHGSDWLGGISGSGLFYEDKDSVCCCGIIVEIINKGDEGKVLCASIEALTTLLPGLTIITSPLLSILLSEIIYYGKTRFESDQLNREVKVAYDRAFKKFTPNPLKADEKYRLHQSFKKVIYNLNNQTEVDNDIKVKKLLDFFKEEISNSPYVLTWLTSEKLHHFKSKINTLSQLEELISLEDVFLKYYKIFLSIEDLKGNRYYENTPVLDQVNNFLDTENVSLLSGRPGSGKTVLAKIIGFQFEQKNAKNIAFYLDLRINNDINVKKILKEIAPIENSLLIIDNGHLNIELINNLLDRWQPRDTKLLLVSRPISTINDDINFQSILSDRLVNIIIDEKLVNGIIEKRLSRTQYDTLQIGDIGRLIQKIEGSFHLLNYYLEVWESNPTKVLSQIENTDIFPKVYTNYIKPYNEKILSILALFGIFEIKREESSFPLEYKSALEELIELGFVERFIISTPNTIVDKDEILISREYVQYFHSSPSKYIIDTLKHFGKPVLQVDYFISYLELLPYNFSEVFYQINQNTNYIESDFRENLIREIKVRDLYRKWIGKYGDFLLMNQTTLFNHFFLHKTISVEDIEYSEECLKLFYDMFSVSSYKDLYYKNMNLFTQILFTLKLSSKTASLFLSEPIDFIQLGQQAEKDQVGVATIGKMIRVLRQSGVSKSSIISFSQAINFEQLGQQTEKDQVGIATIGRLIGRLRQSGVSKSSIISFSKAIDFERLGQQAEKDQVGMVTIRNLIRLLRQSGVSKSSIVRFSKAINFKRLGQQTEKDQVGVASIRSLIELLKQSGVSKSSITSFSKAINFERLGQQTEKDQVGVATIKNLIGLLIRSGVSKFSIINFSKAINFERLGQQAEKDQVGIATIQNLIDLLIQSDVTNKENIKVFLSNLSIQNLVFITSKTKTGPAVLSNLINLLYYNKSHKVSDIERFWEKLFDLISPLETIKYIKNHLRYWTYNAFKKKLKNISLKEELDKASPSLLTDISFIFYQINNPKYKILELYLLREDLQQINFKNCIPKSKLSGISYFLFNFKYSKKLSHLSAYFSLQLDEQQDIIFSILKEPTSNLPIIDNFIWNLLMSYPKDETPRICSDLALQDIITKKYENDKQEVALLSLIGMMAYLSINYEQLDTCLILDEEVFIEIREIVADKSPRSLRILYGLYYVKTSEFIDLFPKYFDGVNGPDNEISIENQETFKKRLRDLYDND